MQPGRMLSHYRLVEKLGRLGMPEAMRKILAQAKPSA